jgi:DHA1 family tetracycline resistance protein-like MFS transporter
MYNLTAMKRSPLVVIFLIVFIDLIGFGIIIPLSPYLATHVGATPFQVGFLMSIYSLMQFIFSPFWGKLSDKVGRRPILLMSLLGSSISYLIFAFSDQLWMLFVARAFAGFFGANISTAMAYIADITEEKNRSKGMGLIGAAFGLGFITGPALGGILSHYGMILGSKPPLGMGFSALGASAICFINFLVAIKVLKESLKPGAPIKERESRFLTIKRYIFRPTLGFLISMAFVSTFAFAHMESTLALYVKDLWNWDLIQASFAFAYVGVISIFTQGFLIRKLMPKYGEPKLLFTGLLLATIGLAGIGFSHEIWFLVISVTLMGLGMGLFNPSNLGSISLSANAQEQGAVMGVAQSFSALGRILGPLSGGLVFQHLGIRFPFWIAAVFMFFGFLCMFRMYKKLPNSKMSKKQDATLYMKIGSYQFNNLITNPVNFLLLDLRAENKNPTLAKSQKTNLEEIKKVVSERLPEKDSAIVIICENGKKSEQAAMILSSEGYINVVILDGGTQSLA